MFTYMYNKTNIKTDKTKLFGMICKERLQTLEETHPLCGIKKVLTSYPIKTVNIRLCV